MTLTVIKQNLQVKYEEVKEKTSYNELDEYQKRRDAERRLSLKKPEQS